MHPSRGCEAAARPGTQGSGIPAADPGRRSPGSPRHSNVHSAPHTLSQRGRGAPGRRVPWGCPGAAEPLPALRRTLLPASPGPRSLSRYRKCPCWWKQKVICCRQPLLPALEMTGKSRLPLGSEDRAAASPQERGSRACVLQAPRLVPWGLGLSTLGSS